MNKPRLIDANEFYTNYCNRFEETVDDGEMDRIAYAIMRQPTAYDIEDVVDELKQASYDSMHLDLSRPMTETWQIIDLEEAIEIVRSSWK